MDTRGCNSKLEIEKKNDRGVTSASATISASFNKGSLSLSRSLSLSSSVLLHVFDFWGQLPMWAGIGPPSQDIEPPKAVEIHTYNCHFNLCPKTKTKTKKPTTTHTHVSCHICCSLKRALICTQVFCHPLSEVGRPIYVVDMDWERILHTFYSPLASWASPFFSRTVFSHSC